MPKQYFKIIPAVYLVLRKDDAVLLLQRHNTGYEDGKYSLPAGHLDGNEDLREALVREAQEEIGIELQPEQLQLTHVQHRRATEEDLSNERIDFYFEAQEWQGEPRNQEPHKCRELKWANPTAVTIPMIDHVKVALDGIEKKLSSSYFGW